MIMVAKMTTIRTIIRMTVTMMMIKVCTVTSTIVIATVELPPGRQETKFHILEKR